MGLTGDTGSCHMRLQAAYSLVRREKAIANRHPADAAGKLAASPNQTSTADNPGANTCADRDENYVMTPFRATLPRLSGHKGVAVTFH